MEKTIIIGLDLAKNVFQAHGARADGSVAFRKKLTRNQVLPFFAEQPVCLVAMEACASAHHWARSIRDLGPEVRLIPPIYVKPFVKRQKNDSADAEAIAEEASRPTMRFVAVKGIEQQAAGMAFRTRDLFIRQKTQTINALRGHLAEYGVIAPAAVANLGRLVAVMQRADSDLPLEVLELARMLVDQIGALQHRIDALDREIRQRAREDSVASRLMTVPGIGPICASAMMALAPPAESFARGRDFSAWLGLVPKQHSSGGKERLGRTSKMGQRDLRRLLITGAMAVVRWAALRGPRAGSWLEKMMIRKPRMLVAVALANKMARTAWALWAQGGVYRDPAAAA